MLDFANADDRKHFHELYVRLEELAETLVWCRKRADRLNLPGTAGELRTANAHVDGVIWEMGSRELPEFARFREAQKVSDG